MQTQMSLETREAPGLIASYLTSMQAERLAVIQAIRAQPIRMAISFARGSSDHATTLAHHLLKTRYGIWSFSCPPSQLKAGFERLDFENTLAFAISQSGQSTDLLDCINRSRRKGAFTLAILNAPETPMHQAADWIWSIGAGVEQNTHRVGECVDLRELQHAIAVLARFPARGLVGVIWTENGFRHLTNSRREVNAPADMRGLKVRTMENQVHMRAFSTLGALPTPMAFSELIPALQQGTVDGQENPISVIVANNINQVQKFMTLTNHVYSPSVMICNPGMINRLSAADRALFQEAARAAQKANRDRVTADDASGVEELRRRGMTVVTQVDTSAFQTALAPAFAEWERTLDAATLRRIRDWKPN